MGARPSSRTAGPVVFDADVLIHYLNSSGGAAELLDAIQPSQRRLPVVAAMEVVHGCRDKSDLRRTVRFMDSAFGGVVHVSNEISRRAYSLVDRYALAHRLVPSDALIAATALTLQATLATGNVRDFRFITGLEILPLGQR